MNALEQAEAYANDATCDVRASGHIRGLLAENAKLRSESTACGLTIDNVVTALGDSYDPEISLYENVVRLRVTRARLDQIEFDVAQNKYTAMSLFTKMRQLVNAAPPAQAVTIQPPEWLTSEYPNGMTQADVHNELHDYKILLDNVPEVYEHVTGGMTSNPMVLANEVIALADDWATESYNDGVSDGKEEAQAVGVPEGWKLVPIEPTAEMCESFAAAIKKAGWQLAIFELMEDAPKVFEAMLAAAPQPEQKT